MIVHDAKGPILAYLEADFNTDEIDYAVKEEYIGYLVQPVVDRPGWIIVSVDSEEALTELGYGDSPRKGPFKVTAVCEYAFSNA